MYIKFRISQRNLYPINTSCKVGIHCNLFFADTTCDANFIYRVLVQKQVFKIYVTPVVYRETYIGKYDLP